MAKRPRRHEGRNTCDGQVKPPAAAHSHIGDNNMATKKHPVTGVPLNVIDLHRAALDEAEQETAKLLRAQGYKVQDIAAMLGTNQGRVIDAIGATGRIEEGQGSLPF
jgi:hypothetical protein